MPTVRAEGRQAPSPREERSSPPLQNGSVASSTIRPGDAPATGGADRRPRHWWSGRVARIAGVVFVAFVLAAVAYAASHVQWTQVWQALRDKPPQTIALAFLIGVCSHLLYGAYDLIGRAWTGHRLRTRQVMQTAFVSYVFNLNLGSLIGGVGMRLRLYQRLHLPNDQIARIIGLAMATNWIGYAAVFGPINVFWPLNLPPEFSIDREWLRGIGLALCAIVAGYLLVCRFSRRRAFDLRGHHIELPTGRIAVRQMLVGGANWMIMALVLYVLLQQQHAYVQVLSALLLGALAGLLMRVPAGLGVLEAVFVALIATPQTQYQVLAAVLAYRALYYLVPLAVGVVLYLMKEARPHRPRPAA